MAEVIKKLHHRKVKSHNIFSAYLQAMRAPLSFFWFLGHEVATLSSSVVWLYWLVYFWSTFNLILIEHFVWVWVILTKKKKSEDMLHANSTLSIIDHSKHLSESQATKPLTHSNAYSPDICIDFSIQTRLHKPDGMIIDSFWID